MNHLLSKLQKLQLRLVPLSFAFVMVFSAVVAQPTHALSASVDVNSSGVSGSLDASDVVAAASGAVTTVKCEALGTFATVTQATLAAKQQVMEAAFGLTVATLQGVWKVEDMATSAARSVSIGAFTALLGGFKSLPFLNGQQLNDINVYESTLLTAIRTVETNIDAAEAAFREDQLSLLLAHQAALRQYVQTEVDTIVNAAVGAQQSCAKRGANVSVSNGVLTISLNFSLPVVILQAQAQLAIKGIQQDASDLAKSVQITATRNGILVSQLAQFLSTAASASGQVVVALVRDSIPFEALNDLVQSAIVNLQGAEQELSSQALGTLSTLSSEAQGTASYTVQEILGTAQTLSQQAQQVQQTANNNITGTLQTAATAVGAFVDEGATAIGGFAQGAVGAIAGAIGVHGTACHDNWSAPYFHLTGYWLGIPQGWIGSDYLGQSCSNF